MAATFDLINSYTVTGSTTAIVTFSSIPGTYRDLRALISIRNTNTNLWNELSVNFNSDSSAAYGRTYLTASSGSWGSGYDVPSGNSSMQLGYHIGSFSGQSNTWTIGDLYFPNYANTSHKKLCSSDVASKATTTNNGFTVYYTGSYNSTSAITSMTFKADTTGQWASGSTFYLYGISDA